MANASTPTLQHHYDVLYVPLTNQDTSAVTPDANSLVTAINDFIQKSYPTRQMRVVAVVPYQAGNASTFI